jgi:hypothetical protein
MPIHPSDYPLLGLTWRDAFYFDKCLPMGCSSSCALFESFSTSLEWVAKIKLCIPHVAHILDDFLFVTRSRLQGLAALERFSRMCKIIGIPLVEEKTVGPSNILDFVGIQLDTCLMEARLPPDKIQKCLLLLNQYLGLEKATLRQLQSLIGLLNFTVCVVSPGRPFLRRLIDLTIGLKRPTNHRRLTREVKLDMLMWVEFLADFNGRSFFLSDRFFSSETLHLFTDSSTSIGFGLVFGTHWAHGIWEERFRSFNIAILEFYPIVLAVHLWADKLANKVIIFHTDNEALVYVINKQTAKEPMLLSILRTLVLVCLKYNILFRAEHIPGIQNVLCDSLSRLQMRLFRSASKGYGMDAVPTLIKPSLHHSAFFLS